MNAIFIPEHLRKAPPPDSLSLVNEFRYVLNSMNRYELKLLPDSSIVLTDHAPEIKIKID
jgi:hypothetical protein